MHMTILFCSLYFAAFCKYWKYLLLSVLEVYQFARDAAVAEAWLMAQEPYLQNQDLGVS